MHLSLLLREYCSRGSHPTHIFLFRLQSKGTHKEDTQKFQADADGYLLMCAVESHWLCSQYIYRCYYQTSIWISARPQLVIIDIFFKCQGKRRVIIDVRPFSWSKIFRIFYHILRPPSRQKHHTITIYRRAVKRQRLPKWHTRLLVVTTVVTI